MLFLPFLRFHKKFRMNTTGLRRFSATGIATTMTTTAGIGKCINYGKCLDYEPGVISIMPAKVPHEVNAGHPAESETPPPPDIFLTHPPFCSESFYSFFILIILRSPLRPVNSFQIFFPSKVIALESPTCHIW